MTAPLKSSLGITEKNIVPSARYNFLFGYAYMGLPAAVMSLHQLSTDRPSPGVLAQRVLKIAVHEIGHTFGLDHHEYDDGIDCVMVGDEEMDSLDTVDESTALFCEECSGRIGRC